jgi:hypothetical protein
MADDAAAPDGELSKSTATEETSSATEPDSGGSETAEAAETEKATDGDEDSTDYDEEAAGDDRRTDRGGGAGRTDRLAGVPHLPVASGR